MSKTIHTPDQLKSHLVYIREWALDNIEQAIKEELETDFKISPELKRTLRRILSETTEDLLTIVQDQFSLTLDTIKII